MPYCPKCGNQVDENMTFCPRCGASLKVEAPAQAAAPTAAPAPPPAPQRAEKSEKGEKREKQQQPEKGEKQEKGGTSGFIGFLIAGLVLVLLGAIAYSSAVGWLSGNFVGPVVLVIIGVVIIVAGVYVATMAKRRYPPA